MIVCRCGHGKHLHRPSRSAVLQKRARGDRSPAQASCHYLWRPEGRKVCKCRDFTPAKGVQG